jgi:type I restriction enzyme S subunit
MLVQLGDILVGIEAGKSVQTSEVIARDNELGVLKVSAVTWSNFRPEEAKAVIDYSPKEHCRVREGDLLITRANTLELVGAVVLVNKNYPLRLLSDKTLRLIIDEKLADKPYLTYALRSKLAREHIEQFAAGTSDSMRNISQGAITSIPIFLPELQVQRKIGAQIKNQLAEVEKARQAAEAQLSETVRLANAIVQESIDDRVTETHLLGDVLNEVKKGVGKGWADYPVLGATRDGLAPARELPGKHPQKYKPVTHGTVFYNPMRILIGSIAFVDDNDPTGITSPDYVVLQGKPGVVDSRWFYYWLRSPLGERCILSLARGAVRERMLFNRLADGEIELPDYATQQRASQALAELKPMRRAMEQTLSEINLMPERILSQAFASPSGGGLS